MQITFPCGAKGRAEFCPGVCQYGKFCKIIKTKNEKPRGFKEEEKAEIIDIPEKKHEVKFYY